MTMVSATSAKHTAKPRFRSSRRTSAEMREIDGMTYAGADAGDDQRLCGGRSAEFGHALQLLQAEASASGFIEPDADCEDASRGSNAQVVYRVRDASEGCSCQQHDHEHASPQRKQHAARRRCARQ